MGMFRWQQRGDPDLFLKYNYPETKDLCKQFLTLVTAVLVFSLTLSEKVVGFQQASEISRNLLAIAWSALLLALILCGVGLTLITLAAGDAVYAQRYYLGYAARAYTAVVAAGLSFIMGLVMLIVVAVRAVNVH
jgi:hypothetical protein